MRRHNKQPLTFAQLHATITALGKPDPIEPIVGRWDDVLRMASEFGVIVQKLTMSIEQHAKLLQAIPIEGGGFARFPMGAIAIEATSALSGDTVVLQGYIPIRETDPSA